MWCKLHGSVIAVVALSLNGGKARDEAQRLQADLPQHIVLGIFIQSQLHLLNPGALILDVLEWGVRSHPPSRKLEVRVLFSIAALQIVVIVTKMDVDYEQHVLD